MHQPIGAKITINKSALLDFHIRLLSGGYFIQQLFCVLYFTQLSSVVAVVVAHRYLETKKQTDQHQYKCYCTTGQYKPPNSCHFFSAIFLIEHVSAIIQLNTLLCEDSVWVELLQN